MSRLDGSRRAGFPANLGFIVGVILLTLLLVVSGGTAARMPSTASHPAGGASFSSSGPATPVPRALPIHRGRDAASTPSVVNTLSLVNGSVYPGVPSLPNLGSPVHLAYDNLTNELFGSTSAGGLFALSASRGAITWAVSTGAPAQSILLNASQQLLYVSIASPAELLEYSTTTGQVEGTVPLSGSEPGWIAQDARSGEILVLNESSAGGVLVINGTSVVDRAATASYPVSILDVGADRELFVGTSDLIDVLNDTSFAAERTISLNTALVGSPMSLTYDPADDLLFAVSTYCCPTSGGTVIAIYLTNLTVASYIATTGNNYGDASLVYDPDTPSLVLVSTYSQQVDVIDAALLTQVSSLGIGDGPQEAAPTADSGVIWVAMGETDAVDGLSAMNGSVEISIPIGFSPYYPVPDPALGVMLVEGLANQVAVVNTTTERLVRTLTFNVSVTGGGVFAFGARSLFLCTPHGPGGLVVVNATTLQASGYVRLEGNPWGIAYDAPDETVLVADGSGVEFVNALTHQLSPRVLGGKGIFGVAYDAKTGSGYAANFGLGQAYSLNVTTLTAGTEFRIPNGTVGIVDYENGAITWDPTDGNLYVATYGNEQVGVVNPVTEKLLATGPLPCAPSTIAPSGSAGAVFVACETGSEIYEVNATGGATGVLVSAADGSPGGIAWDPVTGEEFVANTASDTLAILDVGAAPDTLSARVAFGPATPSPGNRGFNVTFAALNGSAPYAYAFGGLPAGCRSAGPLRFDCDDLAPGNYTFGVLVGDAVGGTASANASIEVDPWVYTVAITESGLPTGTHWQVSVGGTSVNGTGSKLTLLAPNGTFPLHLGLVPGWHATDAPQEVNLSSGAKVTIGWTKTVYLVSFLGSGLASSATWSISINRSVYTSKSSDLNISLANGSYAYTVNPGGSQTVSPSSGTFRVNGSGLSVSLAFSTPSTGGGGTPIGSLGGSSSTSYLLYAAIAVVAVLVVVAVALVLRRRGRPPSEVPEAQAVPPEEEVYGGPYRRPELPPLEGEPGAENPPPAE
jgi:hypothetical protein